MYLCTIVLHRIRQRWPASAGYRNMPGHSINYGVFQISTILLLLLASGVWGSSSEGPKDKRSSVFSLFNLREKSRFWTESVLHGDFDDLASSSHGKIGAQNYSKAGNIANYLKLQEIDSVYLPVPVNFIFVGFEGKGNHEFRLQPHELERWFTKIDHIFEHTRVPQIDKVLIPFYKSKIDESNRHFPLISPIKYNFSVHAIQMNEKVTKVFERAIDLLSRKDEFSFTRDEPEDGDTLWQVDLDLMDVLFASLVEYLQLGNAYNIFILNPKRDAERTKYGYRRGLSESEIRFLIENKDLQAKVYQSRSHAFDGLAIGKYKRPLYEKHPMTKFSWTVTEDTDVIEWSNACLDALNLYEKAYQGKQPADIILSKVLQMDAKSEHFKIPLEKVLKFGNIHGLHAECLTDTWIGRDRWAFIDLSAGPFSWGPAVGGEGVRTEQSLPNVEKTIGGVEEISEDEAEQQLQDAIQEKFSVFGEGDHQPVDILLAEIDIYELFAFKHCKGRKTRLSLCEELDERMGELKNELQSVEGDENDEYRKRKAIEALKRMENWNLFSDTYEEFHNYTVARDTFLAHLGATLWGSMRHIVAPSLADGAYHLYEQISFQIFFITEKKVRHINQLPVDLKAIMNDLSSLLLPIQKPVFSHYMLPLSEDPTLAMAFSVARRAAAVPMLLVNGTFRKTIRTYLDSFILQHQLRRLNGVGSPKGRRAHSRSALEVPIFWFIQSDPLLVDKHYQAKSLSDMVIVVQSEASSWESQLQCNGHSICLDLRSPIKAAMSAVTEHIAGVLPLHLVYSHAHETAIEDWIWSVGCNPFSITSQGRHVSQFHSDIISRSYILTSVEESIQLVNGAIHRLAMEKTSEKSFKLFVIQERELVNKYNFVVGLWRRISTVAGELRYVDALRLLYTLDDASKSFAEQVNATASLLHPLHCARERKVQFVFDVTTIPAFLAVLAMMWIVMRPRRAKPKIN